MPWIDTAAAAKKLNVGKRSIERMIATDEIPSRLGTNDAGRSIRLVWVRPGDLSLNEILLAKFEELNQRVTELAEVTTHNHSLPAYPHPISSDIPPIMAELEEDFVEESLKSLTLPSPKLAEYADSLKPIATNPLIIKPLSPPKLAGYAKQAYGKYQPDWSIKPGVIVHPQHAAIFAHLPRLWPGSISSFEKAAQIPKGFISYARKGKREGPKSLKSWSKVERALEELHREAKDAA
jgi:hypothetical protein